MGGIQTATGKTVSTDLPGLSADDQFMPSVVVEATSLIGSKRN